MLVTKRRGEVVWQQAKVQKAEKAAQTARTNPYVQRIVEDEDLRQNIVRAYESARKAYARLSNGKRPSKQIFDDKKLQKEIKNAAESIKDASVALREAPKKKKRGGGFGKLLLLGVVGAGVALARQRGPAQEGARRAVRRRGGVRVHLHHHRVDPLERGRRHHDLTRLPVAAGRLVVRQQRNVPPQHGEHAGGDRQRPSRSPRGSAACASSAPPSPERSGPARATSRAAARPTRTRARAWPGRSGSARRPARA